MRRLVAIAFAGSLLAMWLLSSQAWASANIVDSGTRVSITGLEAYPQLTFILVAWSLIFAIGRYIKSSFGKFLLSATSFLLFSTAAPVWFESASGSLMILSPLIAKATGVADWQAQVDLLSNPLYNHLAADLFVIALTLGLLLSFFYLWGQRPPSDRSNFSTRIDNLPRW